MTANLKSVEIFSVGKWRGNRMVEVTSLMLDQIVNNFKDVNSVPGYGVPVKLGHNDKIGEPAYGWMSDLVRVGDTLVADFADVPAEIVDAISKRRYNSVSIELWPQVQYAGKVFENVLGGVALLGAEWPAVKGLKPLSASLFAAEWTDEKIVLSEKEKEAMNFTQEQHDTLLTAAANKAKADQKAEDQAAITAAETKATEATARAEAAEKKLAELADKADKDAVAAIVSAAEAKGQIVPATKPQVEAFAAQVLAAASGDKRKELLATFKAFVEAMPAKVKLGEVGASKSDATPAGDKVADEVHAKVQAYMSEKDEKNYEVALAAVFKADPELKTRYAQEM